MQEAGRGERGPKKKIRALEDQVIDSWTPEELVNNLVRRARAWEVLVMRSPSTDSCKEMEASVTTLCDKILQRMKKS